MMRYLNRTYLWLVLVLLFAGCGAGKGLVERKVWQVGGESAFLEDSLRHRYRLEVLRLYHPTSGVLEREELSQEGVEEVRTVYVQVRDTVYIEVERKAGSAAPVAEGVVELERVRTRGLWAGAVPWIVGGGIVLILVIVYVWKRYK